MSQIDKIGRHIFYKKRNEVPYIVEASAGDAKAPEQSPSEPSSSMFSLTPALSLVSTVTDSTTPATPAMSLGYAASE